MSVSAKRKASAAPEDAGGTGGALDAQPFERRIRQDMVTAQQALRWGMTPEDKALWLEKARQWIKHRNPRVSERAMELMVAIEAQNMADQHLQARLQNSGLAIIEARKTIETQPDGTVKETQVMKLYGREAPLEDV